MNRRASVWTITLLLLTLSASSASAAVCRKKITSFWGFEYFGQYDCYVLIGPVIGTVLIGQIIRECDGTESTWGRTDCTHPDAKTVEYEACPSCEISPQIEASADATGTASMSCSDTSTSETGQE